MAGHCHTDCEYDRLNAWAAKEIASKDAEIDRLKEDKQSYQALIDTLNGEVTRLKEINKGLVGVVRALQFGFNHVRCPLCAGYDVGPYGETDKVHTEECSVARILSHAREEG